MNATLPLSLSNSKGKHCCPKYLFKSGIYTRIHGHQDHENLLGKKTAKAQNITPQRRSPSAKVTTHLSQLEPSTRHLHSNQASHGQPTTGQTARAPDGVLQDTSLMPCSCQKRLLNLIKKEQVHKLQNERHSAERTRPLQKCQCQEKHNRLGRALTGPRTGGKNLL